MNPAARARLILPFGLFISVCCWAGLVSVQDQLPFNNPNISLFWQAGLVGLFAFEGLATLAWSWMTLAKAKTASVLATSGPYAFVRHPIFATILWDGTGCVAFYYKAWCVLLALVPLSLLWSYLAHIEERYLVHQYGHKYWDQFANKGQLFPTLKGLDQIAKDRLDD